VTVETRLRAFHVPVHPPRLPESDVSYGVVSTPLGKLVVAATEAGLLACSYAPESEVLARVARMVSPRVVRSERRLRPVRRELDSYFDGELRRFSFTVDFRLAGAFARRVLQTVAALPYGDTATYAQIARSIGRPRAARAVGNALAANPICIVVPCHRVLRSDGSLGGYAGGAPAKRALLRLERGGDERSERPEPGR
jgi:methylated-DNA-[protein]-cysteine S-methyltransferase